jgi:Asp-tRNA(Asn)/Glu-tRNA(Gln) amidotransferase A subunit family amidase
MRSENAQFDGARVVVDDRLYGAWSWIDADARTSWDRAVGAKDVIDVEGQPSGCGFHPWRDRIAEQDAGVMAMLRRSGWCPVGKTATTQFAYGDPAVTVDPRDPSRTPGGSSTGSAVAVALGHVPLAVGTQTGGSVVRPAGYCGVVGVKPTYGAVPVDGVHPLAPSLDTVGLLAASVRVAAAALSDLGVIGSEETPSGPGPWPPMVVPDPGGLDEVTSEGFAAVLRVVERELSDEPRRDSWAVDPHEIRRVHRIVLAGEAWTVHRELFSTHPEHYAPRLTELLEEGRHLAPDDLARARRHLAELGGVLHDSVPEGGVALCATSPTQAPGRRSTGSSLLATPWTVAGGPVVAVPWHDPVSGARGGVQVVARPGQDARCLLAARNVEVALGRAGLLSPVALPLLG